MIHANHAVIKALFLVALWQTCAAWDVFFSAALSQDESYWDAQRTELLNLFPDFNEGTHGLTRDDVDDVIRLKTMILNTDFMLENLKPLNTRMKELMADPAFQGKKPTAALSAALAEKELAHGFQRARVLPLGILSAEIFNQIPQAGYIAKDTGAGVEHGEYTHRLQWYAIMNAFEKDLRPNIVTGENSSTWRRTPFELFTAIGGRDAKATGSPNSTNLWAHLMDRPGFTVADYKSAARVELKEGFRRPDDVVSLFRNLDHISKNETTRTNGKNVAEDWSLLADAVTQRFDKRKAALTSADVTRLAEAIGNSSPTEKQAWREFLGMKAGALMEKGSQPLYAALAGEVYRMKKVDGDGYVLAELGESKLPLSIKRGEAFEIDKAIQESESMARKLRTERFKLPLRDDQQRRLDQENKSAQLLRSKPITDSSGNAAVNKVSSNLAKVSSSTKSISPATVNPASTHGVNEPIYSEIPKELKRRPKPIEGTAEPIVTTLIDPTVGPPRAVVNQYDEIPLELRDPVAHARRFRYGLVAAGAAPDSVDRLFPDPSPEKKWKMAPPPLPRNTSRTLSIEEPPNRRVSARGVSNRTKRTASVPNVRKPSSLIAPNKVRSNIRIANQRALPPSVRNIPKPGVSVPRIQPPKAPGKK